MVGPRDIPHTFRNVGSQDARLHLTVIPGRFANYFIDVDGVDDGDQAAIKALDGMSVDGRSITVNLARPREEGRSPAGYGADGFKATKRADVGYGNGGYGGGRY